MPNMDSNTAVTTSYPAQVTAEEKVVLAHLRGKRHYAPDCRMCREIAYWHGLYMGRGTPILRCSFALHRGEFCTKPDRHAGQHAPHSPEIVNGRTVCSCGDYNCASLD